MDHPFSSISDFLLLTNVKSFPSEDVYSFIMEKDHSEYTGFTNNYPQGVHNGNKKEKNQDGQQKQSERPVEIAPP